MRTFRTYTQDTVCRTDAPEPGMRAGARTFSVPCTAPFRGGVPAERDRVWQDASSAAVSAEFLNGIFRSMRYGTLSAGVSPDSVRALSGYDVSASADGTPGGAGVPGIISVTAAPRPYVRGRKPAVPHALPLSDPGAFIRFRSAVSEVYSAAARAAGSAAEPVLPEPCFGFMYPPQAHAVFFPAVPAAFVSASGFLRSEGVPVPEPVLLNYLYGGNPQVPLRGSAGACPCVTVSESPYPVNGLPLFLYLSYAGDGAVNACLAGNIRTETVYSPDFRTEAAEFLASFCAVKTVSSVYPAECAYGAFAAGKSSFSSDI